MGITPIVQLVSSNPTTLLLSGDWTLAHYHRLSSLLNRTQPFDSTQPICIEFDKNCTIDSAGCQLLAEHLGTHNFIESVQRNTHTLSSTKTRFLLTLLNAIDQQPITDQPKPAHNPFIQSLDSFGSSALELGRNTLQLIDFIGQSVSVLLSIVFHPSQWRVTSFMLHLQQSGLNAIPIVALLTFLIGAVVAFLGSSMLGKFGASVYTVHLVSFSFLREFGPLLAAIIVAGRTASAYTAHIGAMKANEEIDALYVMGVNPISVLVIPRLFALLIALPILTFVSMMFGLAGGMLVSYVNLDISYAMFFSVLQDNVGMRHFWVGMVKAPFFAFIIAMISCLEGFKAQGSARSVGEHTTSSVVQSIFMVIIIDALVAIICVEMGW